MFFKINKIKNTVLLFFMIVVNIIVALLILFVFPLTPPYRKLLFIINQVVWTVCIFKIIRDYKSYVEICVSGIVVFRNNQLRIWEWKHIKRISCKKVKNFPIFDALVLHTSDEQIFLDYNFIQYKQLWHFAIKYYEAYGSTINIDVDVP